MAGHFAGFVHIDPARRESTPNESNFLANILILRIPLGFSPSH